MNLGVILGAPIGTFVGQKLAWPAAFICRRRGQRRPHAGRGGQRLRLPTHRRVRRVVGRAVIDSELGLRSISLVGAVLTAAGLIISLYSLRRDRRSVPAGDKAISQPTPPRPTGTGLSVSNNCRLPQKK
jgi:hypothetical protein